MKLLNRLICKIKGHDYHVRDDRIMLNDGEYRQFIAICERCRFSKPLYIPTLKKMHQAAIEKSYEDIIEYIEKKLKIPLREK